MAAASFSGSDTGALLAALVEVGYLPSGPPATLKVGSDKRPGDDTWIERCEPAGLATRFASWPGAWASVQPGVVVVDGALVPADADDAAERVARIPCELACFAPLSPLWYEERKIVCYSLGEGNVPVGWALAFRGDAHRRLVSRRWLDHGPWRLIRGENDTSFLQLYDLAAEDAEAMQQADRSAKALLDWDIGGLVDPDMPTGKLPGLYSQKDRRLVISVLGREVEPREMLRARALVVRGGFSPEQPVERVTYSFAREDEARAHLHALWLRELQCLTYVDGVETMLDRDYAPPVEPPAWARASR